MKKKFSRILGVIATIALLASFMVPVSADVSVAKVDLDNATDTGYEISADAEYTITFAVTKGLDSPSDNFTVTAGASLADEFTLTATAPGTVTVVATTGSVSLAVTTEAGAIPTTIVGGVITFGDIGDIVTATATANGTAGTITPGTGTSTDVVSFDADGDATVTSQVSFSLPDFEGTEITYVVTTGSVSVAITADTDSDATIVGTVITLPDAGDEATIYATADTTAGTLTVTGAGVGSETVVKGTDTDGDAAIGGASPNWTFSLPDGSGEGFSAIVVVFPEDTDITLITPAADLIAVADVTVGASSGVGVTALPATPALSTISTTEVTDDTLTIIVPGEIGPGATVQVIMGIGDIIENPPDVGDYTLEVSTSEEDDAVTSETYTLEVPDIDVPAGVVRLYNPSNILMANYTGNNAIQGAIDDPKTDEDFVIKVGPGRYEWPIDVNEADITIEAAGTAEETIIVGDVDLETEGVTLDGFTIDGSLDVLDTADENIIEDCIFEAETELDIAVGAEDIEVTDCSFTVEKGDLGLDMNEAAEITDCTFDVEDGGKAIDVGPVADGGEITDCTFNGVEDSGDGIILLGDTDVTGCTFDGLDTALQIAGGTQVIDGNTIQDCEDIAIDVDGAVEVLIHNNTITGCNDAVILDVAVNPDKVFMLFNDIVDNAGDDDLLINNDDAADLYVINNWWGDADGPEQGDDAFSDPDDVIREPFLPASSADGAIKVGVKAADFKDDCDVKVVGADQNMDIVAAARYPENPGAAIDDAVGFWDVFVIDTDDVLPVTELTIRFYTDVTENTEVWVWGEAKGEWLECAATPNLFAGFIAVDVSDDTTPTLDDLGELPFVVVDPGEGTADAVEITAPEVGAVDVSVTPTLAWGAEEDATYEIQITQDATFAILDEAATSPTNAYIVTTALAEGQSYYWRVRAVTDAGAGDWATGVFTTAVPVEPTPPIEIVETGPPEITVTMPPATITQAIDPGLLWAIVGVGAVLVISLIVLIVRTRRAV